MAEAGGPIDQGNRNENHYAEIVGPDVADKRRTVQSNLDRAVSQVVQGDSIHPGRKENVLSLLTGMAAVTEDPHGLGQSPGSDIIEAKDAERLADFVRTVNKLGSVNQDGSVILNRRPSTNPTVQSINVPPRR